MKRYIVKVLRRNGKYGSRAVRARNEDEAKAMVKLIIKDTAWFVTIREVQS